MNWDKVEWSKFSPQEAHRLRYRMMEEKHRGHDLMHAEMIIILFGSILVAQIILFLWRQKHYKSYQLVTLLGLWFIPMGVCLKLWFVRMMMLWTVFSLVTIFIMYKATRRRISVHTPRRVC